jgi:hypothetical protein
MLLLFSVEMQLVSIGLQTYLSNLYTAQLKL